MTALLLLLVLCAPDWRVLFTVSPPGPCDVLLLSEPPRLLERSGQAYVVPAGVEGPYTFRFKRLGYRLASREVPTLGPPGDVRVPGVVELAPLRVHVTVPTEPRGASLYAGDSYVGVGDEPLTLDLGPLLTGEGVKLTATLNGCQNTSVTLAPSLFPDPEALGNAEPPPVVLDPVQLPVSPLYWPWYQLRDHTLRSLGLVGLVVAPLAWALWQTRLRGVEAERRRKLELVRARPAQFDPLVGTVLGGYLLEARIGIGGMATVYRGLPEATLADSEAVAVKVMKAEYCEDAELRKRFVREMQVNQALIHPHIVQLHDMGEAEGGVLYMVMELVEGQPLNLLIPRGGMTEQRAAAYMVALVDAMAFAHRKGVVHRDLKPKNIFVTSKGVAKVLDFGIAIQDDLSRITQTGTALGTPAYMPPEQFSSGGKVFDPRSDQYALGITFYELLTGEVPFEASDPMVVAFKQMHDAPPSLRSLRSDVSPSVERVVLKMLRKDPMRRFDDLAEVKAALQQALEDPDAFSDWETVMAPARRLEQLRPGGDDTVV